MTLLLAVITHFDVLIKSSFHVDHHPGTCSYSALAVRTPAVPKLFATASLRSTPAGLEEVVKKVRVAVLVAGLSNLVVSMQIVVHVLLLPFHLLALFCQPCIFCFLYVRSVLAQPVGLQSSPYLLLSSNPLLLPLLLLPIRLLLPQVRVLLHLRLVQPVDDSILALLNVDPPHHLLILEAHLPRRHTAALLQIAPWGVDDRDIVLLVAFDAIRLRELGAVGEERFRYALPLIGRVRRREAEVDVGGGEVVDVEPDVLSRVRKALQQLDPACDLTSGQPCAMRSSSLQVLA